MRTALPGRWIGGLSCLLGPSALLAGILLRADVDFFFPEQLAAYARHPVRWSVSYGAFAIGVLLLVPAVLALAAAIAPSHPRWARWGALLTTAGLGVRLFHAGQDHLAFRMIDALGPEAAHQAIADTYAVPHPLAPATPLCLAGWIVLAVGAFRAGVLGPLRALALATTSILMIGVLKGTDPTSILAAAALAAALVPFGTTLLRTGPWPPPSRLAAATVATLAALGTLTFLGTAG
ncbi:hypothetical protein [Saccharopolyspora sp. CA-218241]|uniref:hypothetical protein n=1 Tax=Saccharopolyspora sp. CA-218241 TaxID=3240027 RepID=UPI003D96F3B4